MYNSGKKSNKKPVKIVLSSTNKSYKDNQKEVLSTLDNNKNKLIHEKKLKEIELLERELNNIENQNNLLSNEINIIKDKQKTLSENFSKISTEVERHNNELIDLKKINLIKNKEYLLLLNFRIRQQIFNSLNSELSELLQENNANNNDNNTNENNTNGNNTYNTFNLLLNLSRLRRIFNHDEEVFSPTFQSNINSNNNSNEESNNEEGPPISYNQLQNLPSFNYIENNYSNEKCIICGIVFSYNDVVTKLRCHHNFHKNCLINRLISRHSSKCPICKNSII